VAVFHSRDLRSPFPSSLLGFYFCARSPSQPAASVWFLHRQVVLLVDSFPGYEDPWVLVFPFPADPFCCPGYSSCSGLISEFRASEAHPGVGFLTCRPSCCFFSSPISVSACLHLLSRDLFFPFFFMLLSHRTARTTIPCRFFASHRVAVLLL
jgi:hypothetical protein